MRATKLSLIAAPRSRRHLPNCGIVWSGHVAPFFMKAHGDQLLLLVPVANGTAASAHLLSGVMVTYCSAATSLIVAVAIGPCQHCPVTCS